MAEMPDAPTAFELSEEFEDRARALEWESRMCLRVAALLRGDMEDHSEPPTRDELFTTG